MISADFVEQPEENTEVKSDKYSKLSVVEEVRVNYIAELKVFAWEKSWTWMMVTRWAWSSATGVSSDTELEAKGEHGEDLNLNCLFSHLIFCFLIQLIRKFEISYSTCTKHYFSINLFEVVLHY